MRTAEDKRLEELREYDILDSIPEKEFDDIVKLASAICETPISLISLVDKDRQWFKARVGLDVSQTPREQAFCAHALSIPDELLIVDDPLRDERFKDNPLVLGDPNIRFYAGAPLKTKSGQVLGTLCVIDTKQRKLSLEKKKALNILSKKVMELIEQRVHSKKLEKDNERHRAYLEHIASEFPGSIFQLKQDKDGKFSLPYFSNLTIDLPGIESDQFGKDISDLFSRMAEEDLKSLFEALERSSNTNTRFQHEMRVVFENQVIWLLASANPHTNHDGTKEWNGFVTDITERKARIQELELHKKAIEYSSEGILFLSVANPRNLTIKAANNAYLEMTGYSREEVIGQSIELFVGPETDQNTIKKLANAIQNRMSMAGEILSYRKNGQPFWNFFHISPIFNEKDQLSNYLVITADISEQKRTNILLEEISQISQVGGWELDLVENMLTWSNVTKQIHEVPLDHKPLLETSINFYKEGESRNRIQELLEEVLEDGESREEELEFITAKGNHRWVSVKLKCERSEGKNIKLYGTIQDISQRRKYISDLNIQNQKLKKIAWTQSHVVRAPLARIMGLVDLLGNMENIKDVELEGLDIIEHIIKSTEELDQVIKDIIFRATA